MAVGDDPCRTEDCNTIEIPAIKCTNYLQVDPDCDPEAYLSLEEAQNTSDANSPETWLGSSSSSSSTSSARECISRRARQAIIVTSALTLLMMCTYTLQSSTPVADQLVRRRTKASRIVGGQEATQGAYPYIAALYWGTLNGDKPVCGGTIITPSIVITAAHCVYSVTKVELNRHDVRDDEGVLDYKIRWENKWPHPDYDFNTYNNDIAIIQLPSRHPEANVASLPRSVNVPETLTAIGWGLDANDGSQPNFLMEVDVKYQTGVCEKTYNSAFYPETMLCAGDVGKDSCQGDSGSGLVERESSTLEGVTSWGYECASDVFPGIYTRVSAYVDWIDDVVCNHLSPEDCIDGKIRSNFDENTPAPSENLIPSPSAAPTDAPSSSPSHAPSATPSMVPPVVVESQYGCRDQDYVLVGNFVYTCEWVARRKDRRCGSYGDWCPVTCQKEGC